MKRVILLIVLLFLPTSAQQEGEVKDSEKVIVTCDPMIESKFEGFCEEFERLIKQEWIGEQKGWTIKAEYPNHIEKKKKEKPKEDELNLRLIHKTSVMTSTYHVRYHFKKNQNGTTFGRKLAWEVLIAVTEYKEAAANIPRILKSIFTPTRNKK